MDTRSETLDRAVERLSEAASADVDVAGLLDEAVTATHRIFGLRGAGFMVADADHTLRTAASSDEVARQVEQVQQELADGPCVRAFVTGEVMTCDDTAHDERWPVTGPRIAEVGIGAVMGIPVSINGAPVGVLNVYADAHRWTEEEQESLRVYAGVIQALLASVAVAHRNDRLARQLSHALDNRVTIERAVGYLMARGHPDPVDAFQALRQAARSGNRKLVEVARDVVAGRDAVRSTQRRAASARVSSPR